MNHASLAKMLEHAQEHMMPGVELTRDEVRQLLSEYERARDALEAISDNPCLDPEANASVAREALRGAKP